MAVNSARIAFFAFFVETVQIAKVTLTVSFAKEAKIVLIAKVVIFASTVCTVSAEAGRDHASEAGWPGKLCGSHGKRYPEFAKGAEHSGNSRK